MSCLVTSVDRGGLTTPDELEVEDGSGGARVVDLVVGGTAPGTSRFQ